MTVKLIYDFTAFGKSSPKIALTKLKPGLGQRPTRSAWPGEKASEIFAPGLG
jgi:hypothetical protein